MNYFRELCAKEISHAINITKPPSDRRKITLKVKPDGSNILK